MQLHAITWIHLAGQNGPDTFNEFQQNWKSAGGTPTVTVVCVTGSVGRP
jgi:hypothetical protein